MPGGPKLSGNSPAAKPEPRYLVICEAVQRDAVFHAAVEPHHAVDHELHEAVVASRRLRPAVDLGGDDARSGRVRVRASRGCGRSRASRRAGSRSSVSSTSMPSKTIHCAPISSFFASSMASMPPRSKSPACTTSGERRASRKNRRLRVRRGQAPVEGRGVGDDLRGGFLERDEDARARLRWRARVDQALQRKDGLAGARAAHDAAWCDRAAGRRG